jgi:peptidoglycan/xylan/chitin deacetylase (PgdA/CDA1 family)
MKSALKRLLASPALTRSAAAGLSGCALILGYHDIGCDVGPGNWLRVRQGEFDRQLTWLSRIGSFITPGELPGVAGDNIVGGSTTSTGARDRAAAPQLGLRFLLTFDDGYVNNHRLAVPLLERHRVPALFFVSTWHASTSEPFWFDRVVVPIQAEGRNDFDLRDLGLRHYRFRPQDDSSRWDDLQRLLADIKALGNPGSPAVDRVLRRCDDAAGARGRAALADCRPLQVGEIRAMHATGLCHFGSHAHRHEILTYLDDAALAETMRASRAFLETALSAPPHDLAYPNGDADKRVLAAARTAGFQRGYAARPGIVRPRTASMDLPRLLIGGYDTPGVLAFKLNYLLLRAALA